MADYPPQDRKMNRTLTQKYDMHALRALQKLEAELLQWLAELYGCEEDGVPVEVDLLEVYNLDPPLRAEALKTMLAEVTFDTVAIRDKLIHEMEHNVAKLPHS